LRHLRYGIQTAIVYPASVLKDIIQSECVTGYFWRDMNFPLVLMSFGVGILIGLTSMGGAALMAPFLILIVVHLKQGTVELPVVRKLAFGSVPGGILGALLVILLPRFTHDAERFEQRAIGFLLVLVAVVLLARLAMGTPQAPSVKKMKFLQGPGTVIWGAIVGFCVGLTSVGSGSLLAPFLMMLYPSKTAKIVGTDVCHAAVLVSVTGIAHAASGGVEWHLVPMLLAGSIPGVLLGSRLAVYVPARSLRTGLAAILLLTGFHML
jgi:uncharacterized membrane protein YfcA